MMRMFLLLGFILAVLIVSTNHSEAADKHSRGTRSRSAALTELGRALFFMASIRTTGTLAIN